MSLSNLFYFYHRRLRARLVQELFALIGIAVGVALLFAVQVSNTSLNASIVQLTNRFAGRAQLQIRDRGSSGFDAGVLSAVRRLDGVVAAAPLLETQANVIGPHGSRSLTLLSANPAFARLGGDLLSAFTAGRLARLRAVVIPNSVAKELGVRFGNSLTVQIGGRSAQAPVGAIVDQGDVGPLAESPTMITSLAYGQELAGMEGRVSRIYVIAHRGRIREVRAGLSRISAGRLDVLGADSDSRLFAQAATPNDQSTDLFAAISALVGFLFAFNAMLLLARERRALIAELRMSGFGVGVVVQVLVFDAVVLGIVASLVGLALGNELSRDVFRPAPGYLTVAFPVDTARVVRWQTVVLAIGSGVLATVLATASPLMSMLSRRPLDATDGESNSHDRRSPHRYHALMAGLACLAVTTISLVAAPQFALIGMAALLGSMLLTLPTALRGALSLAYLLRRRVRSIVPLVAIGELLSAGSRSVALAAIAAIAVFGSTAIEGAHRDLGRALDRDSHELNAGPDLWVSAAGSANVLATSPFRSDVARQVARVPQVSAVGIYRGGFLNLGDRRVWVLAPPRTDPQPIPPSQIVEGDLSRATALLRTHGWAVVSQVIAEQQHLHVGTSFRLDAPRPSRFRVAAISTNLGWSPGSVIVNADDYATAWATTDASALHVSLVHGVSAARGARLVAAALGPASGLNVETAQQREQRHRATSRQALQRLTQIAMLVLIAAALAMAAAMGGMIWQRRRRLAELKLVGIDHRQLWRALLLESALLLGIGCSLGAVYGIYGEQLLDRALNTVTGFPVDYSLSVLVAFLSLAIVTAVALGIAMVPGYLAARVSADAAFQD